ncbi:zinc finger protein 497 isoform X2 [Amyelois transitella]|uniref:zinc finger protein 497 isoform X2 n=1 Tax=Amyelois transitella TaxID=680683 RepID=UPI00298F8330|nr:zinc finger protein 497 isoform X2 [Amyelois transitella]
MDGEFSLHWEDEVVKEEAVVETEQVILGDISDTQYTTMTSEEMIEHTDQMAAENLMYLSQDIVNYTEAAEIDPSVECVTEEVVTDDWVISGGQERVEVPLEHLVNPVSNANEENNIDDVPLPTDQDEYTAMRPWPCDFCSRRFRKKAALMNHMVAHQNDRPHACNLCGVRYVRKCDLMNHLKVHAFVPDSHDPVDYEQLLEEERVIKPKKKRGRRKKNPEPVENGVWENMTSARTQQWSRRRSGARPAAASPPPPPAPASPPTPPTPPPPADPSRPFVCGHCGVGFAREKALQSHSRIHGGDSPIECGECGELCWSRDGLASHAALRHPHLPPRSQPAPAYGDSDSDDDMDYQLSPVEQQSSGERPVIENVRGPSLFCQHCGVAFQRADLLRRHVAAAHSYKRHDSTSSTWGEHTCDVCGETCSDALQLLAHAELHTSRPRAPPSARLKKVSRGRNNSVSSSSSRQFPCKECGKVFGSRSSQQIHVRIHTGERPYACRFCWKAFADGGTLRKHERIHTGEKPYACAVCPRAFNQRVVLREHVRSHHSAPDRRNGCPTYSCVVCEQTLLTSADLVQHLIQHCDVNTALKRQPQAGPRKYKRRRKVKAERWSRSRSPTPVSSPAASPARSPAGSPARSPAASPAGSPAASPPRRRRRPRAPPPRPKMIHTEETTRPRTKQVRPVRSRRPPRHPADDLRAIRTQPLRRRSPTRSPTRSPSYSRSPEQKITPKTEPPNVADYHVKRERTPSPHSDPDGPYKCEMCSLEFPRRDALLLHVPVHI